MGDGEPGDTSVALTSPSSLKGYEQDPLLIVSTVAGHVTLSTDRSPVTLVQEPIMMAPIVLKYTSQTSLQGPCTAQLRAEDIAC